MVRERCGVQGKICIGGHNFHPKDQGTSLCNYSRRVLEWGTVRGDGNRIIPTQLERAPRVKMSMSTEVLA
jgi:hypothetical protein